MNLRRILALMLSVLMLVSALPLNAIAEEMMIANLEEVIAAIEEPAAEEEVPQLAVEAEQELPAETEEPEADLPAQEEEAEAQTMQTMSMEDVAALLAEEESAVVEEQMPELLADGNVIRHQDVVITEQSLLSELGRISGVNYGNACYSKSRLNVGYVLNGQNINDVTGSQSVSSLEDGKEYSVTYYTASGSIFSTTWTEHTFTFTYEVYHVITADVTNTDITTGGVNVITADGSTLLADGQSMEVDYGTEVTFEAVFVEGYTANTPSGVSSPVKASGTVSVTYTPKVSYNVTVSENIPDAGAVKVNGTEAASVAVIENGTAAISIDPTGSYYVSEVKVNGSAVVGAYNNQVFTCSFTVSAASTVEVTYAEYKINVKDAPYGIDLNGYKAAQGTDSYIGEVEADLKAAILNETDGSYAITFQSGTLDNDYHGLYEDQWIFTNIDNYFFKNYFKPGTVSVRITKAATAQYPEVSVTVDVTATESRADDVSVSYIGEIIVADNQAGVSVTADMLSVTGTAGTVGTVGAPSYKAGTFPNEEDLVVYLTYKVTISENENYVEIKDKEFTVPVQLKEYTITWDPANGEEVTTTSVGYGLMPTAPATNPTKADSANGQYKYEFTGWTPAFETVTGNQTYTAAYDAIVKSYTISWDTDGDGDVDTTSTIPYGGNPADYEPDHADIENKSPNGWDPAFEDVTGDETYTAQFSDDTVYTVTFKVDGTVYETQYVNETKGETIAAVENPDKDYAVFAGWTNADMIGTVPASDVILEAQWLDDTNNNNVADEEETATVEVEVIGNGNVVLKSGETEIAEGDYLFNKNDSATQTITVTTASNDTDGTDGSRDEFESLTINGEPLEGNTFTVADGETYNVVATYKNVKLEANDGEAFVNCYNNASKAKALKATLLDAAMGKDNYNADDYTVYLYSNGLFGIGARYWNIEGDTYEFFGTQTASAEDIAASVAVGNMRVKIVAKNVAPELSKVVTITIKDSRSILKITTSDVTIEAKSEPSDVADRVKNAISIKATDPQTGAETVVEVVDSYVSYSYVWPEDATKTTVTVTVNVTPLGSWNAKVGTEKYQHVDAVEFDLTLKDTTILKTVIYTDGVKDEVVFEDQTIGYTEHDAEIPAFVGECDVREYYDFNEWVETVDGNTTTRTATWTPTNDENKNDYPDELDKFTVQFVDGESVLNEVKDLSVGEAVTSYTPTAEQTPAGKYFAGWDRNVVAVAAADAAEGTCVITYEAKWDDLCTVAFEGFESYKVEKDTEISAPETNPTKESYLFQGWAVKDTADIVTFPYTVNNSVEFVAVWAEDFNRNDIDDAKEDHFTITYMDGEEEVEKFENVLVGLETPTVDDLVKAGYKFNGWNPAVAATVTADATYTAQWLNDSNNNDIDDALETVVINVTKANDADKVTIGNIELVNDTNNWVYDSKTVDKLTIKATPDVVNGVSASYVASINGAELAYDADFAATAVVALNTATAAEGEEAQYQTIEVIFADAGFVYNDERLMNYYDGMADVKNDEVYNAIVKAPALNETAEYTIKYKAREAMSQTVQLSSLGLSDTILNILSMVGVKDFTFDMPDLWLDVNVETEGQVKDSVSLDQAVAQYVTVERITGLWDIFNDNGGLFGGGIGAVRDEIAEIYENVYAAAMYYGAHNFGYNATGAETVTEQIKITYKNAERNIVGEKDITLKDMREASFISGSNVALKYKDYTDEELAAAIGATVVDAKGNAIAGAEAIAIDITDPYTFEGKNVSETAYELKFKFAGNETYKPAEATFNVTIEKAPIENFDAENKVETYTGSPVDLTPSFSLGNKYGEKQEVLDSLVQFVIGLDVADLAVDMEGNVSGLEARMQIILPDDLQSMLDGLLGLTGGDTSDGMVMSLSDLLGYLGSLGEETTGALSSVFDAITGIAETSDIEIVIGGDMPSDIGLYLHGAVTTSTNYEIAFDVGYLVIKPNAQQAYLNWDYTDSNGVFTWELLQHVDFGATAYTDETYANEAKYSDGSSVAVQSLFFGFNADAEEPLFLQLNPSKDMIGNGAYTQLAFVADFGNEMYYAVPIIRAFAIIPNVVEVEIVDEGIRTFNNEAQIPEVELSYKQGSNIEPDAKWLTMTYTGIQTNGKLHGIDEEITGIENVVTDEAPIHAGAYIVTATYIEKDDSGKIIALGMDVQEMIIAPAESEIEVIPDDNNVRIQTTLPEGGLKVEDLIVASAPTVEAENYTPDYTTIVGKVAIENGMALENVYGNVNIDLPDWLRDALGIEEGAQMPADELMAKVTELAAKIDAAIAEQGLKTQLAAGMESLTENLAKLNNGKVTLTIGDQQPIEDIGAYLIVGVVTDSDHIPSVDADYLLIVQEIMTVEFIDENGNLNDERVFEFDNTSKEMDVRVTSMNKDKGENGVVIDTAKGYVAEGYSLNDLTFTYTGIKTNANIYAPTANAPVNAGAYAVTAVYAAKDNGVITAAGMASGVIAIVPTTAAVEVEDEIRVQSTIGDGVDLNSLITITTPNVATENYTPDTTTIVANVALNGGMTLKDAYGKVQIDVPAWLDAALTKYYPNYADGSMNLTAEDFVELLDAADKAYKAAKAALAEYGIDLDSMLAEQNINVEATLKGLIDVLTQIPGKLELVVADEEIKPYDIGAYIVVSIVTDSDVIPAADYGLLLIVPEIADVQFIDENGVQNGDRVFTYDGTAKEMDVKVTDMVTKESVTTLNGNTIAGLKVLYTGAESAIDVEGNQIVNTPAYLPKEAAPAETGAYVATAIYVEYNADGVIAAAGMDIGAMVIVPAEAAIEVEGGIYTTTDGKTANGQVSAVPADAAKTVITTGLNLDKELLQAIIAGEFTAEDIVVSSMVDSVNVTLPTWMTYLVDAVVEDDDVSIENVIKALTEIRAAYVQAKAEIKEMVKDNYATIAPIAGAMAQALDIDPAVVIAALNMVEEDVAAAVQAVIDALNEYEDVETITFFDDVAFNQPGVYMVMGIVTDSDYKPAMDANIVVIAPVVAEVELVDANENNIFYRTFGDDTAVAVDVTENGENVLPKYEDYLTVTYTGIATDGKTTSSETAPEAAGVYVVTATYLRAMGNGLEAIGADVGVLVIAPKNMEMTLGDNVHVYDGLNKAPAVSIEDTCAGEYKSIINAVKVGSNVNINMDANTVANIKTVLEKLEAAYDAAANNETLTNAAKILMAIAAEAGVTKEDVVQLKNLIVGYLKDQVINPDDYIKAANKAVALLEGVRTKAGSLVETYGPKVVAKVEEYVGAEAAALVSEYGQKAAGMLADVSAEAIDQIEALIAMVDAEGIETVTVNDASKNPVDAGEYKFYAIGYLNSDHTIDGAVGTVVIEPVQVTVTAENQTIKAGEAIAADQYTVTDAEGNAITVEGLEVALKVTDEAGAEVDYTTAGTYKIVPEVTFANGNYTLKEAVDGELVVESIGRIIDVGRTLSLEGLVYIENFVRVEGFEGIDIEVNGGLLVWDKKVTGELTEEEAVFGSANALNKAGLTNTANGYQQRTGGIAMAEYADEVYLRAYIKVGENAYVYGPLKEYSVQRYCELRISKNAREKDVCIAMLHLGTEAQKYFNYNVGDYANANIAEQHPSKEYSASLIDALDMNFSYDFEVSEKVTSIGKTLSLESAIVMDAFYTFDGDAVKAELLTWDDVSGKLDVADAIVTNMVEENGRYHGQTPMIPSAKYGDTLYICARFTDSDGNVHYSKVNANSPDHYCEKRIPDTKESEVCKKLAIYSEEARAYFGYY